MGMRVRVRSAFVLVEDGNLFEHKEGEEADHHEDAYTEADAMIVSFVIVIMAV